MPREPVETTQSCNGRCVELAAPAKVNLGLLVGPLRADGFHEICSLMVPVTLADLVKVEPAPGQGLSVECEVCRGEANLAARIVRALERRLPGSYEVRVTIRKRVPEASGLGGGSSDAATTLLAIERLFALELPAKLRYEIAQEVGADVPFFLWPGPQLVMGKGNVLKDVEVPDPLHIVVAVPADLRLSTADVYRWRDEDAQPTLEEFAPRTRRFTLGALAAQRPQDLAPLVTNDLEGSVASRRPAVAGLKRALREAGAFAAAMSGSGPSVFGLFADEERARAARDELLSSSRAARAFYVTDLQPKEEAPRGRRPSSKRDG
jgi:4-diphosphocytidyl-2-C-methyl-D-erythritol kinase